MHAYMCFDCSCAQRSVCTEQKAVLRHRRSRLALSVVLDVKSKLTFANRVLPCKCLPLPSQPCGGVPGLFRS